MQNLVGRTVRVKVESTTGEKIKPVGACKGDCSVSHPFGVYDNNLIDITGDDRYNENLTGLFARVRVTGYYEGQIIRNTTTFPGFYRAELVNWLRESCF